ncbi:SagB/ThcOx family dehydrogenase [Terasakiispira papahanaumokuakeensis]|nr:SagB/ThcOx family dehydrogenase [Terasakiispira papahanaumokuakeensis]
MKTSSTYVRGNEYNPPATLKPIDVNKKYLKIIEFSDIRYTLENDHSIILHNRRRIKKERAPSACHIEGKNLSFTEISDILYNSFGSYSNGRRPYPSGGAIYPIGFIVCVLKDILLEENGVLAIQSGVYQYRPSKNSLDEIWTGDINTLKSCILSGKDGEKYNPTIAIIYVNHPEKNSIKYRYKSYRLSLMEVGSAYQSAIETANLLGIEQRLLASFCDFEIAKELGLDARYVQPCVVQIF